MRASLEDFVRRRIKKAQVQFISLCRRGKNGMEVLYKGDGTAQFDTIVKASADAGELLALVYPAERRDLEGDIASAEVIRGMAHSFQRDGGQIDIQHDGKAVGRDRAYVAENFIVQKGDPRFADQKDCRGQTVDATGGWAVLIKIDDPELRRLYREGGWNGVSLFGPAEVVMEKVDDEAPPSWFTKALRAMGFAAPTAQEDMEMKKEELQAVLVEANKSLLTDLVKALKPEAPAVPPATPEKLDLTDAKAVEAHLAKLKVAELAKGVDFTDPKQVEAYLVKLKGDGEPDAGADGVETESDEVAELKAKLAKAEKRSNQPAEQKKRAQHVGLSKEQVDQIELGDAMAAFLNGEEGKDN